MKKEWLIGLALCAMAVARVGAQTGSFRIAGRVVSALDGHPLERATVAIDGVKSRARVATAISGADGKFVFEHLTAGKYTLFGEAPGYVEANFDQHEGFSTAIVTGATGVDAEHLQLQLRPAAAIAGRVSDEAGEPVRMAQVTLYRESYGSGKREVEPIRTETTNDRGEYGIGRIGDGKYFLGVRATPWYATHPQLNNSQYHSPVVTGVDPNLDMTYPLTFYPDVTDWREAAPLEVKAGGEMRVDVHLVPVRGARLTIRATPGEQNVGYPQMRVKVFDHYEPVMGQMQNFEGGAEIVGLPPGRYAVQQSDPQTGTPSRTSSVDLTSGGSEISSASGSVMGRLKVTVQAQSGAKLNRPTYVTLQGEAGTNPLTGQTNENDEATFERLPAGEYRMRIFGQNRAYTLMGINVKGHASSRSRLTVASGESAEANVIVSDRPLVSVEGVARRDAHGVAGAMIVLVPIDDTADTELFRRDQSDLDGTFALPEVLPGRYIAVAIEDGWKLEWGVAAVLSPYLLKGVAVEVGGGGTRTMQLPEALRVQAR